MKNPSHLPYFRLINLQPKIIALLSLIVLVSLACSTSLPGATTVQASPTATPSAPLPPTIIETIPPVGSQIPLQSPLTIYFSEKMEHASVESAFSDSTATGGFIFNWVDDSTLTFVPKSALPANSKVSFTLAASAKSTNGLSMLQPISISYQTPGPLKIAQVLPAASALEVSPDSAVVIAFNQPVVALGADPDSLPAGLTIEPSVQGKGEWLNTSTYIFHADPALAGGAQYTVRVNPKLVSVNGMSIDSDSAGSSTAAGPNSAWAFSTSLPKVLSVTPTRSLQGATSSSADRLYIDTFIHVSFNQPMERASVERGFSFSSPAEPGPLTGAFEWNKKFSEFTFKPARLLARDSQYTLSISAQSISKGGAALGYDTRLLYTTVAPFGMTATSFPNNQVRPQNAGVTATFSAPVAKYSDADLQSLISVSPKPPFYSFYVDETNISVSGGFNPGKTYTITFSAMLKDRWGQSLTDAGIFTFTEPDAQPALNLANYSQVMFTRPEDPAISVQAVNINTITVSRGSMSLDDFQRTLADYNLQQSFIPANNQTFTVSPGSEHNANQAVDIKLSDKPLTPGIYALNIDSSEVQYHNNYNKRTLVVSNINVTIKTSPTEALIWAVDLRKQTPVTNIPVVLYDQKNVVIATGVTDEHGLFRGQLPQPPSDPMDRAIIHAILGQPGDDQFGMAMTSWGMGISPWDFNLRSDTGGPRLEAYLYSERPVYRPGDVVHYRGILKNGYDGRYTDSALNSIDGTWYGPNGKLSASRATISAYGTFNGEYTIPASSAPGGYSFTITNGGKDVYNGSLYIQVADYRKPEIELSVALSPNPARSGANMNANVKAAYFFGSPVPDLPFTWRLYTGASSFSIPEYSTGIQNQHWLGNGNAGRYGNIYLNGEGRTGPDGSFNIPFNNIKVEDTTQLTLEITASESGGFPISASATSTIHPADFYIGVRPDAWVGQAGSQLGFSLLSVDWDKKPVSKPLDLVFQKVRWERTDMGNFGMFDFTPVYTPIDSRAITTAADGLASISFTPPDPGTYMLDVTAGSAHTQMLVWVGGGENAEWPNLPYQQIQITSDKNKYKPGDTAQVFIPNPFNADALALLTTERSTIKSVQVVTIPAAGYRLSLPLSDDSAPNIYVSATLLGPQAVDFRQGYVNLPVDPSALILNVTLKASPEKARPGDTLTLDLTVSDSKNQPVQGEFSIAVVDLAALALADPNSIDIVPAYYDIQSIGVITGLTAAVYTRRLLNFAGGQGGGGGDGALTLRDKFPDTAYWKADIVTDVMGKGRITLTLPDNLTTWQVETRGLSTATRVGQARIRVVTSKELLIRPQTPRFLVVGDRAELAAIINNTTSSELQATANLQASGFTLDDPVQAEQTLTIPANGRARVSWSGLVQAGETVDAIFSVKSGDLQDASRPSDGPIPVLLYSAPQTFSTAGILSGISSSQEIIAVPRSFQPLGGNLQVELSPSLAAAILGSLKVVVPDPAWSTEQIVSAFLPNVVTYVTLKESGIDDADLNKRLENILTDDLRTLLASQREDGTWAWTNTSPTSDLYLTAYVLFGLQQAQTSGLNLDGLDTAAAIQKGRNALLTADAFTGQADLKVAWQANRAVFFCYILQQTGLNAVATVTDQLYENRNLLDPWARSLLAVTLYNQAPVDARVTTLLSDLETSAIRSATGVHWESSSQDGFNPSSPLFTTAVVLAALAERTPASPLVADAARYLASQRSAGDTSGYDTSWVILALNKYMKATGELRGDFAFSAALNGAPLAQGQAGGPQNMTSVTASAPLTQLNLGAGSSSAGVNSLLIDKQDGTGKLYYRAALTVDRPVESALPISRGITVTRQFMDCSGTACFEINSYQMKANASGRVTVRLTVTLSNDTYYLAVQDYIPAGADILDSSLKTSQQSQPDQPVQPNFDPADPFGEGWGWWLFNQPQIYTDHILWSADYLPAGTYDLTYTIIPSLAGQYRVLPAHAWQSYFPEVQGTTSGAIFEIKPIP